MAKTISFHNGTTWSRGHNIRDERYTRKQEHIDKSLTEKNVIIRDVPVRKAYEEIFGQSVDEYNAKQKRSDRKIIDYYEKVKQEKKKHTVYEDVVQIGDRSDTGNDAELEKQALIRFAEEWEERNPNLHLIGAYIHCDEPDGTVHLHIDYIPVAECSRGMKLQNSLDRALRQQGFQSENIHQTAQIAWQEREREALCSICKDLGIDVRKAQGRSEGRKHLSKQEYIEAKKEQQSQIESELHPLKEQVAALQRELDEKTEECRQAEQSLQNLLNVPIPELKLKPYPEKQPLPEKYQPQNEPVNSYPNSSFKYRMFEHELEKWKQGRDTAQAKIDKAYKEDCQKIDSENEKARQEWETKYLTAENIQKAYRQIAPSLKHISSEKVKLEDERRKIEQLRQGIEQEVERKAGELYDSKIQEMFGGTPTKREKRLEKFCEKVKYEDGSSVMDAFLEEEEKLKKGKL